MKRSKKLLIYELHTKSYAIISNKLNKNGRFVQNNTKEGGITISKNIPDEILGKIVRTYLDKCVWSEKWWKIYLS